MAQPTTVDRSHRQQIEINHGTIIHDERARIVEDIAHAQRNFRAISARPVLREGSRRDRSVTILRISVGLDQALMALSIVSSSNDNSDVHSAPSKFVRSGVASALAVQVEYAIYLILTTYAGVQYLAASAASSGAALAIGFCANKFWAFRRTGSLLRHFSGYVVVLVVGTLLGLLGLFLIVDRAGVSHVVGRILVDIAVFCAWMFPASLVLYAARPGDPDYRERVRATYQSLADTYYSSAGLLAALWDRMAQRQLRAVMTCIGPIQGEAVLDVGCGAGTYARALNARGATVTAIDIAPAMIAKARPFVERVYLGDFETLELTAAFHIVLGVGVLDFVEDVPRAIRALAARVAPGGRLVLLVPLARPSVLGYYVCQLARGFTINLFRVPALDRLARAAGLVPLTVVRPLPYNAVLAWARPPVERASSGPQRPATCNS